MSNIVYDTPTQFKVGKEGENLAKRILSDSLHIPYKDVTDDKRYQSIDVDFIIGLKNSKTATLEVKNDKYDSTNIFAEMSIVDDDKTVDGWVLGSKATLVWYFQSGVIYQIPLAPFRDWVLANKPKFYESHVKNQKGKVKWHAVGYLVPHKMLIEFLKTAECARILKYSEMPDGTIGIERVL